MFGIEVIRLFVCGESQLMVVADAENSGHFSDRRWTESDTFASWIFTSSQSVISTQLFKSQRERKKTMNCQLDIQLDFSHLNAN